jgi:hypothetical protein
MATNEEGISDGRGRYKTERVRERQRLSGSPSKIEGDARGAGWMGWVCVWRAKATSTTGGRAWESVTCIRSDSIKKEPFFLPLLPFSSLRGSAS